MSGYGTDRPQGVAGDPDLLALLVDSVSDYAIFALDVGGNVASWNVGAERLKGYRADEILGRHLSVFYTNEEMGEDLPGTLLHDALENGRVENEGWRVRKDGSRFWASVVITTLRSTAGVHRGFAKVTRDLTDRKRSEDALQALLARERDAAQRLRDLDRIRADAVELVAHDLRAPLAVIGSLAHLLRSDWDQTDDDAKLEHLIRMTHRVSGMSKLIDDLLDVAHIDSGRRQTERQPFEIGWVIEQAIHDVVAPSSPAAITVDTTPGLRALGDAGRTRQVVANLLSNAIKFSPTSSPIRINAIQVGEHVIVAVTDQGRGVEPGQQHLLFRQFSRLMPDDGISGSGVGLFIAKSFVEEQGGTIEVESTPTEGSTFRFRLPVAS